MIDIDEEAERNKMKKVIVTLGIDTDHSTRSTDSAGSASGNPGFGVGSRGV